MRTWSISCLMSSTELFEAASSSTTLNEAEALNDWHESHSLHASISGVKFWQLIVFAKIRAHVVFPTPRGPQKRYACPRCLEAIEFFSVRVIDSCPTTEVNVEGLYFRAETKKFSITLQRYNFSLLNNVY